MKTISRVRAKGNNCFGLRFSLVSTVLLAAAVMSAALQVYAANDDEGISDLFDLSLQELLDIEVTSVSRRSEKLSDTPSAIQVITEAQVRRSGSVNLVETLRLAHNLNVSQQNAHEWVVSARGFSSDVGNKLLVMMDGRTLYTPLFSGVFWDRQDYVLADIDRIEVISGPGALFKNGSRRCITAFHGCAVRWTNQR